MGCPLCGAITPEGEPCPDCAKWLWEDRVTPATKRVLDALSIPGVNPDYHLYQLTRLRKEWPVLYWAVVALQHENKEEA